MPRFKTAVVLITAPNRTEAENIGRALLEKRLAACVQYENIVSQYVWMGETCRDDEIRITVKSVRSLFKKVAKTVRANSSYDCPQILMLPVSGGSKDYLRWLKAQLAL